VGTAKRAKDAMTMPASYTGLTADQVRTVVSAAALAPSVHNSQPWRWVAHDGRLDLYADPARHLPAADPAGRQLLMSCGAALLHARLTIRQLGLVPTVTLPARGATMELSADAPPLATITVTAGTPPDAGETALAEAIVRRHTDRRPFDPRPLEPAVVTALRHAAEAEGAWLVALDEPDQRIDASVLLARADWLDTHDPAYIAELTAWSRTHASAVDGIPRAAVVAGAEPRRSEFVIRDFDVVGEAGIRLEHTEVERPAVILLGTDTDTPAAELAAGQALERVLLTATTYGIAASPLGQVIDIEGTRELLRETVGGMGHVQMLIRVGYPLPDADPLRPTPRRPIQDILSTGDPTASAPDATP
jgi:nitroreductase